MTKFNADFLFQMVDETPWAQLASLALFKLFNDWQAQGYQVPTELLRAPDNFNNQGTAPLNMDADFDQVQSRLKNYSKLYR